MAHTDLPTVRKSTQKLCLQPVSWTFMAISICCIMSAESSRWKVSHMEQSDRPEPNVDCHRFLQIARNATLCFTMLLCLYLTRLYPMIGFRYNCGRNKNCATEHIAIVMYYNKCCKCRWITADFSIVSWTHNSNFEYQNLYLYFPISIKLHSYDILRFHLKVSKVFSSNFHLKENFVDASKIWGSKKMKRSQISKTFLGNKWTVRLREEGKSLALTFVFVWPRTNKLDRHFSKQTQDIAWKHVVISWKIELSTRSTCTRTGAIQFRNSGIGDLTNILISEVNIQGNEAYIPRTFQI